MNILVTGGLGYIGSHTVVELHNSGYNPIIVDNLSNAQKEVKSQLEYLCETSFKFYNSNVSDYDKLYKVFLEHDIGGIIHFAAYKSVAESVKNPLKYYKNNLETTLNLMELASYFDVNNIVYSSSATVYGDQQPPLKENMPLQFSNTPYGQTKVFIEQILHDYSNIKGNASVKALRYFNPVGAHKSGLIGENPKNTPTNIMPIINQVAFGEKEKLFIYGNDYDTKDGTAIRDYIHVIDLAKAHIKAIEFNDKGFHAFNIGTGKGISVLELVKTYQNTNKIKIPYKYAPRRLGDQPVSFADSNKANQQLNWVAKESIENMCYDSYKFEQKEKSNE